MTKKNETLPLVSEIQMELKKKEFAQQINTDWIKVIPIAYDRKISDQDLDILAERINGIMFYKAPNYDDEELDYINSCVEMIKESDEERADYLGELSDFISRHFCGKEKIERLVRLYMSIIETFDRIMYIYAVAYMSLRLLEQNLKDIPLPTMVNESGDIVPIPLFAKN